MAREADTSGQLVYPKLQVPQQQTPRHSAPRVKGFKDGSGGGGKAKWIVAILLALALGAAGGYIVKSGAEAKAHEETEAAAKQARDQAARADDLSKQLADAQKAKSGQEAQLAALSSKAADVDKKAAELAAEEKKLQGTIDASQGSVSREGDEIHLKLVDKVLFAVGDDQLTDKGKAVLDKVAGALTELPDKAVFVQGHTDDQPIFIPPPKKDKEPPKDAKAKAAAAKAKPTNAPSPVKFITNWELSAARALQVVHYLQDVGKIDPTRLAALAFGQYRPVSKTNKALNRRIEIVLYPRKQVLEKSALPPPPAPAAGSAAPPAPPGKK